ncbi:amino acid ABC transporter permease [Spirulina sp. 06S082]|uniref:amino acid ABC transporter permease n=1 Tax=Spirulina sp. 06S082 TaxID=3110248 RepID=UPI002B1EA526|nr:amino acid ABC transporter permease [Spirulina sp. 06S082]MEA5469190.1 amino acid ABC transporter permease [Spirulina sp. 06S082]
MTTITPQNPNPNISPPAEIQISPINWVMKNLLTPWYNALITFIIVGIFCYAGYGFCVWALTEAQWTVVPANLHLFGAGRYPSEEYWRLWVLLSIIVIFSGISWGVVARNVTHLFSRNVLIGLAIAALIAFILPIPLPYKLAIIGLLILLSLAAWGGQKIGAKMPELGKYIAINWFLVYLIGLWLIGGGFGLEEVTTSKWGGLMLTVLMATISIALCFPIGVIFALGRQSNLPIVKLFSVLYIEIIRGIPLIAILFMGQVMIPLFLPEGMRPDRVLRAIIGLTLFSSAYLAENIRGGLQAIPRGQTEAAKALGLSTPLTVSFIVMPQAIKAVIPAIVGQFISLFQDTTLLSIVGVEEFLGISRSVLANPNFLGRSSEVLLFNALGFWVFCYAMSTGSKYIEKRLNVEH